MFCGMCCWQFIGFKTFLLSACPIYVYFHSWHAPALLCLGNTDHYVSSKPISLSSSHLSHDL